MKKVTRQWLRKAENDLRAARHLFTLKPLLTDEICFHAQQAIEKFLKSLLAEQGLSIQKTHDLTILLAHLLPTFPSLRPLGRDPICGRVQVSRYEHQCPTGACSLSEGGAGSWTNPQNPGARRATIPMIGSSCVRRWSVTGSA
jgi:hypothetical protein